MTKEPVEFIWWRGDVRPCERWPGVSLDLRFYLDADGVPVSECGRFWYDQEHGSRFERFCAAILLHVKGPLATQPIELLDWQTDLIFRPLFGVKDVKTGLRRFRTCFLAIAKKQGKSLMASALGVYLLGFDGEMGAEVYSAAANEVQARIVFGDASTFVKKSPHLGRVLKTLKTSIVAASTDSVYRVLSSAARSKHGFNIHGLLFDELHTQRTRDLWETLSKGVAARSQPITFITTTAGDTFESICGETWTYAKHIISGKFEDTTYLPAVFEAGPTDDWTKEETWRKANPSLGVTISPDYFEKEVIACRNDPRKLASFRQLHLNQWVGSAEGWIDPNDWAKCKVDVMDTEGLTCVGGLDLSSKTDITALALVFRRPEASALTLGEGEESINLNYSLDIRLWCWLPEEGIQDKERADRVPYQVWADQGFLTLTPGAVIDYDYIVHTIDQVVAPAHAPVRVAYDPWNATQPAVTLDKLGHTMVETRQGFKTLSEPTKVFEALVKAGRVRHDGNPLLAWCVENTSIKSDENGNQRPVKSKVQSKRIDPVVAILTGLSQLLVVQEPKRSVYEDRGLVTF